MSKRKYDILVFIGRFMPFHNGHKAVIDRGLELADTVLVLAGSANRSRSMRTPFTFDERKEMIQNSLDDISRVFISPLDDVMYNDETWIEQVQSVVHTEVLKAYPQNSENVTLHGLVDIKIGLIGCEKDHTSYYLKLFPKWGNESIKFVDPINSTDLREAFFKGGLNSNQLDQIPVSVLKFLSDFFDTSVYTEMVQEIEFIKNYKESVQKHPRIEQTVDAVVVQSGHVLLIKRKASPGKNQWALPGGFINQTETLQEAMLRELKEETKIKVPPAVLKSSIVKSKTFDNPNRSDRARIITQAFLIKLQNQTELPKVKGSDDAAKAKWVALAELDPKMLFEDHAFIIQDMIG